MTGYGDAGREEDGVSHSVEIRSLNNRYFKATIRLPELLQFLEPEIERLLRSRLGRGSISYFLRLKQDTEAAACKINTAVVEAYLSALRGLADEGESINIDLATMMTLPGVCQAPELDEVSREKQWAVIERLTHQAIDRLIEMRRTEGVSLHESLLQHCEGIRRELAEVKKLAPAVVDDYRKRLEGRVNVLLAGSNLELHEEALVREVAVFADRCDISEELSRLRSHLDQFAKLCDSNDNAGRRLDFLTQEMLRESNTIGSKANNAEISKSVVEIKSCVDRLREQVQNVE